MKKHFILFLVFTLSTLHFKSVVGQSTLYKPFKVDLGLTFAKTPNSDIVDRGLGVYIEPKYNLNDKVNFGLHLESTSFVTQDGFSFITTGEIDIITLSSTLLTSDYYFNTDRTRPFIGVGIGMYKGRHYESKYFGVVKDLIENDVKTNFGFMPRVGINSGHFKLSASYHFSGRDLTDYLSINVGFEIGGGKIK